VGPAELNVFLNEMTEVLDSANHALVQDVVDRMELRQHLRGAVETAEQLQQREAAANDTLAAASRDRAELLAVTLQQMKRFALELIAVAKTRAEEALSAAQAEADRVTAEARRSAHEMLAEARENASQAVAAAERAAAQRLADVQLDADRITSDARRRVAEIRRLGEEHLAGLIAHAEGFQSLQQRISQDLAQLARDHATLVETMGALRTKIQAEVLPLRRRLLQDIAEDAVPCESAAAVAPTVPEAASAIVLERETAVPQPNPVERPDVSFGDRQVQVVLQDVDHRLATEFIVALHRLKSVKVVVLQYYDQASRMATIDLIADRPFDDLDLSSLGEFRVTVLADTGNKVTVSVERPRL
jgi:hypothetical protein